MKTYWGGAASVKRIKQQRHSGHRGWVTFWVWGSPVRGESLDKGGQGTVPSLATARAGKQTYNTEPDIQTQANVSSSRVTHLRSPSRRTSPPICSSVFQQAWDLGIARGPEAGSSVCGLQVPKESGVLFLRCSNTGQWKREGTAGELVTLRPLLPRAMLLGCVGTLAGWPLQPVFPGLLVTWLPAEHTTGSPGERHQSPSHSLW